METIDTKKIGGVPVPIFWFVAQEVMKRLLELPKYQDTKKPEHCGGYLALQVGTSNPDELFLEIFSIGNLPKIERTWNCFRYCQKKVDRMRWAWFSGRLTTGWQTRKVEEQEYGGAIIAPPDSNEGTKASRGIVGAFSGLSEHADEAFTTVLFLIFRFISYGEAKKIAQISDNPLTEPLMHACGSLFNAVGAYDGSGANHLEEKPIWEQLRQIGVRLHDAEIR